MIFHDNYLLVNNSHGISYLIFFQKFGKKSINLSSAAVVIGALRVKGKTMKIPLSLATFVVLNSLDPDQNYRTAVLI